MESIIKSPSASSLGERFLDAKRALFERAYASLNPRQQEAVFQVNGPLLVLAGAGSGKTTVLVRRIAFFIHYGNAYHSEKIPNGLTEETVKALEDAASRTPEEILPYLEAFADDPCPPYRVLAITFTNKAANEIKARLASMFPEQPETASEIWAGTFHSICMRILRRYGEYAGYRPGFSVYDTDDSKKALAEAIKRAGESEKTLPIKAVASVISRAKDRLISPEEFSVEFEAELRRQGRLQAISKVYEQYQMLLRESNALDFDDIIMQTVLLLRRRPDIAKFYQDRFRYVCVDEYQDTNPAQFALTRLLAADPRAADPAIPTGKENLMVVGDDDQSIYKFRGATIENILTFHKLYTTARVIRLEQNYRSTQHILDAANAVISHNTGRMGKTLWTAQGEGARIGLIECDDQNVEARRIVDEIQKRVARTDLRYRDFAVLYRMNAQSQSLEKAFARAAIPYRMLGGLRFTDRKEIRDAVAYLQLIVNPHDNVRLKRIINEPKRKIGDKTLEAIAILASEQDCSHFEIIERASEFMALKNARPMLESFADLMHTLAKDAQKRSLDALFDAVLDRSGYRKMLADAGEAEADRLQNLEEFKSQIIEYVKEAEDPTLIGFLEETALVADVDRYDEEADAVVMMTVHSAKGLEFPVVFLPGMEDGIFPGMQSVEAGASELEEERRLAYVAITRAKQELIMLHTSTRLLFGRTSYNPLSRFASEIPEKLVNREKRTFGSGLGYGQIGTLYGSRGASPSPEKPRTYYSAQEQPRAEAVPIKKASSTQKTDFRAGDRVRHITFGTGEILSVRDMGADTLLEVMFDRAGTKKLMASYARLKRE